MLIVVWTGETLNLTWERVEGLTIKPVWNDMHVGLTFGHENQLTNQNDKNVQDHSARQLSTVPTRLLQN